LLGDVATGCARPVPAVTCVAPPERVEGRPPLQVTGGRQLRVALVAVHSHLEAIHDHGRTIAGALAVPGGLPGNEMSGSGMRPRVLRDAFRTAMIPVDDLPELINFAWTRDDSPTSDISETDWLEIFRHTGFFSYPPVSCGRPNRAVRLYRGSTADRLRNMSWTADREMAELLSRRHARYDTTAVYRATVMPDAILAYLKRRGEGLTVVVDPAGLADIERIADITTCVVAQPQLEAPSPAGGPARIRPHRSLEVRALPAAWPGALAGRGSSLR